MWFRPAGYLCSHTLIERELIARVTVLAKLMLYRQRVLSLAQQRKLKRHLWLSVIV